MKNGKTSGQHGPKHEGGAYRTTRVFELFFLDIPGFSGFLLLSYPVCGPQKLSRFFMNSQALLLSAFRIFPQLTFYLINRRQRTFKILRYQF